MVHLEVISLILVHSAAIVSVSALGGSVASQWLEIHEVRVLDVEVLLLVDAHIAQEVVHLVFHWVHLGPQKIFLIKVASRTLRGVVGLWLDFPVIVGEVAESGWRWQRFLEALGG